MTIKSKITTFLSIYLSALPFMANAEENFPRQDDLESVDSLVVAAIESVEISKRALIYFGTYDEKEDPAKWTIMQISARGYNMQRQSTPGLPPMYSMRFIMRRVQGFEDQVVRTFKEKRAIHCVSTEGQGYEALPGTDYRVASTFCRARPDWRRYEIGSRVADFETAVGSTAR